MNLSTYMVDAAKLKCAILSIPVVYPPELAFLGETPVTNAAIVRSMLAGPVYISPGGGFLALFVEINGRCFLELLVTSDSLANKLLPEDEDLLRELYKPPRRVGWWERLTAQRKADKLRRRQIRQDLSEGRLDARQARAFSRLYFPVLHDDDVVVAFPEDDFTDRSGKSDDSWEKAVKSSGIKAVSRNLQPLRCGLPRSFCNQLLAKCREKEAAQSESQRIPTMSVSADKANACFERGARHIMANRFDAAVAEFTQLISMEPCTVRGYLGRADACACQAAEIANHYRVIGGKQFQLTGEELLSQTTRSMGSLEKDRWWKLTEQIMKLQYAARHDYEKVLEIEPGNPHALKMLQDLC